MRNLRSRFRLVVSGASTAFCLILLVSFAQAQAQDAGMPNPANPYEAFDQPSLASLALMREEQVRIISNFFTARESDFIRCNTAQIHIMQFLILFSGTGSISKNLTENIEKRRAVLLNQISVGVYIEESLIHANALADLLEQVKTASNPAKFQTEVKEILEKLKTSSCNRSQLSKDLEASLQAKTGEIRAILNGAKAKIQAKGGNSMSDAGLDAADAGL